MAIKGVGQNFRYLRVMLGIPQKEVAKQAGLSQRSVRMFEIENTDIMLSNLIALCNAISMPVATVLYGRYYDEMQTIDSIVKKFHENSKYRKRVGDIIRKKKEGTRLHSKVPCGNDRRSSRRNHRTCRTWECPRCAFKYFFISYL